jgi:hypothetical protein
MAYCQSLNRWDRCRLGQIRYHFVLMIRNRNQMACCHFAIRTQSLTVNLIANPNRIGCQTHSVSRFAIHSVNHCWTIHCRSSRYHLARWIPSYLMRHYLKIHFPMSHCRRIQTSPMSRSIPRNLRRWNRRTNHHWNLKCRMCPKNPTILKNPSYPRNRCFPMSQKSRSILSFQTNHSSPMSHCCQSYRWNRNIRWSLSCRFARRNQSFRGIQEGCRIQMARCCRSIPRSHLNPTSQTSR